MLLQSLVPTWDTVQHEARNSGRNALDYYYSYTEGKNQEANEADEQTV